MQPQYPDGHALMRGAIGRYCEHFATGGGGGGCGGDTNRIMSIDVRLNARTVHYNHVDYRPASIAD